MVETVKEMTRSAEPARLRMALSEILEAHRRKPRRQCVAGTRQARRPRGRHEELHFQRCAQRREISAQRRGTRKRGLVRAARGVYRASLRHHNRVRVSGFDDSNPDARRYRTPQSSISHAALQRLHPGQHIHHNFYPNRLRSPAFTRTLVYMHVDLHRLRRLAGSGSRHRQHIIARRRRTVRPLRQAAARRR